MTNTKTIILSDTLKPIVDSLTKFGVVHDGAIGYAGIESDVYKYFSKLYTVSTDNELIELTDHDSACVRVYAFWALAKRNNQSIKTIMDKHIKDSTQFWYMSGCILEPEKVNDFFIQILTPQYVDVECLKLTAKEIEQLRTKMKN